MQRKVAIGLTIFFVALASVLLWLARDKEVAVEPGKPAAISAIQTAQQVADAIEKSKTDTRFKTGVENMPKSTQGSVKVRVKFREPAKTPAVVEEKS